jgi:hypothetical protein
MLFNVPPKSFPPTIRLKHTLQHEVVETYPLQSAPEQLQMFSGTAQQAQESEG